MPNVTNCHDPQAIRPRLETEITYLYRPRSDWTYSHHPSLTAFRGRLYAMWSNGRVDEDAPGQRVFYASSADGSSWSSPRPLVDSLPGKHSELVLTAAGFHSHGDRLVAYAGQYECEAAALARGVRSGIDCHHEDTRLRALVSADGETWGDMLDLGLPIVPNHPPQATRSGRLIICGNISFPYTDDPSGLSGWRMTGLYPPDMAASVYDDSEGFWHVKERLGWPVGLCEGAFYQTDDGVLHMLLRSGEQRLWLSESSDDGATWSAPAPADFSDNDSKFHFGRVAASREAAGSRREGTRPGRLPDGRFYYVGTPDPLPRGARNPLVLSLSEDGERFDRHFVLHQDEPYGMIRRGRYKGGLYGYPHSLVHDGRLYVIVSLRKEAVAVLQTPLAAL